MAHTGQNFLELVLSFPLCIGYKDGTQVNRLAQLAYYTLRPLTEPSWQLLELESEPSLSDF